MPCCHPLPHHRRLSIAVGLSLDRLSPSRPGSQINRAVVKDLDNQLRNGGRRTTAGRKRRFLVPSDLLGFDGLHASSENDLLVRRHLQDLLPSINGRRCGMFGLVLPRRLSPCEPAWPVLGHDTDGGIAETLLELLGQLSSPCHTYLDADVVEHVRCCV